jgi:hypothetical protein
MIKKINEVQIRKIFYDEASFKLIKPPYIPLDNSEGDSTWFEFLPILNFVQENRLSESGFYGFFSPRFEEKTGFSPEFTHRTVQENFDKDAVLFSPGWDQLCFYQNPWEQGEQHHPGIVKATQEFLDYAKISIDIRTVVSTRSTAVFSNCIVAKATYWKKWARLASKFHQYCSDMSNGLDRVNTNHRGDAMPLRIFIQERLPSLVLADNTLKTAFAESSKSILWPGSEEKLRRCDVVKASIQKNGLQTQLLEEYSALRLSILRDIHLKTNS